MGEYIVYETDERMYFLRRMLKGRHPSRDTHIFAPNIIITEERMERVKTGDALVCGVMDDGARAAAADRRIDVYRLSADEKFQARNAALTAEAALAIVIDHSMLSLDEMRVLVMGFGRTGAAVCRLLDRLNVKFDVVTGASARPAGAFAQCTTSAETADLSLYDVVINTVPEAVISDERALTVKPSAVYVDLASTPALNIALLRNLGMDAEKYPALPAKCSPESAARAIKDFIAEVVE